MKILYISHLSENIAAGLNWSVPASVDVQSKIDDVLWINTTNVMMPHWKRVSSFHNLDEYGEELHLDTIPKRFRKPDVVVFEGLYFKEIAIKCICFVNKSIRDITYKYFELNKDLRKRITMVMCSLYAHGYDKDAKLDYFVKEYGLSGYVTLPSILKNCKKKMLYDSF